jgi:serine acetyltransferase
VQQGGAVVLRFFLAPDLCVLPRKRIASRSTVGIGSVPLCNVKEGTTVFGIPAMEIKAQ